MARAARTEGKLQLIWAVAVAALVAVLVFTKLGKEVAAGSSAAISAAAAAYSAYTQRRDSQSRPPNSPGRSSLVAVCHVREDLRWALWLEARLDAAGFQARLQQLPVGQDSAAIGQWAAKIVAEAACVLVVMSPEFVELGSGAELRLSALAHSHRGRDRSVCVITDESVTVTTTVTTTEDSLSSVSIADIHDETAAWRLIEDAVRGCGARSYTRRAVALKAGGVVFPGVGVTKANLPAVNHNFVGRATELATLHAWLVRAPGSVADRCVAIYAMSGMGKTQLATEFVNRLRDFDSVWWIHAHLPAAIYDDLSSLAQELGLPKVADQNELRRQLWERLRTSGRWLLVYDNAESEEKLRELVPPAGNGSLLITSQSPNWATLVRHRFELEHMSEQDAVTLLRRRIAVRDDQILAQIAEQLGWLPLALEQAASYMCETQCTPPRYLDQLTKRFSEVLEHGTQAYYDRSAGTTYRMARERTTAQVPLSGVLLELCGFFSPEAIPRDLFESPSQAPALPPELAAALDAGLPYDAAVSATRKFSLLTVTETTFTMHRVVQKLIRDSLRPAVRRERAAAAVRLLAHAFPDNPDEAHAWALCGLLLSHCLTALDEVESHDLVSADSIRLSRLVGEYQRVRGAFDPALKMLTKTLNQLRGQQGGAGDLAAAELALAKVYYRQADLREAKEHALAALALHEAAFGPDDQRTAANLLDLSQIRLELSEFDEALENARHSLLIHQAAAAASPALAGLSLETLGIVQWRLGDWPEATASLSESVGLLTAALGADDGITARAHTALGLVVRDAALGDITALARAENAFQHAYRVLTNAHGAEHPDTVSAAIHLADARHRKALVLYRASGDRARFERTCRSAAADFAWVMQRAPMKEQKPGRACGLVRQGHLLNNLGEHVRARELVQEARGIYIQSYGADHPYVAEALTRLIGIEYDLGDHVEASRVAHEARRIYVSTYGDQHPYVNQIDAFLADPENGGRD